MCSPGVRFLGEVIACGLQPGHGLQPASPVHRHPRGLGQLSELGLTQRHLRKKKNFTGHQEGTNFKEMSLPVSGRPAVDRS